MEGKVSGFFGVIKNLSSYQTRNIERENSDRRERERLKVWATITITTKFHNLPEGEKGALEFGLEIPLESSFWKWLF